MNAPLPLRRGVSRETLAVFDLALDEQIRHLREAIGRNEHDMRNMRILADVAQARYEAHDREVASLKSLLAYIENLLTGSQRTGSVVEGAPS